MRIDFEKIALPITDEHPCGENLEELSEFYMLEEMVKGEAETQFSEYVAPDWKEVYRNAISLLQSGKHIWVAIYLLYSATNINGIKGASNGLNYIKILLEKYWDIIPPVLDDPKEEDYTLTRLAPLYSLSASDGIFLNAIKEIPIIKTIHFGTFSYNELINVLEGNSKNEKHINIDMPAICSDVNPESLDEILVEFNSILSIITEMNDFINSKVGEVNNVSKLNKLLEIIQNIIDFFHENFISDNSSNESIEINPDENKDEVEVKNRKIEQGCLIRNHRDIVSLCDEICNWYQLNEPSSPVPFFIRRGKGLVGKGFMDIINNLSKESNEKLSYLFGLQQNGNIEQEYLDEFDD